MCGIVGIWNRAGENVPQAELDAFTDSLHHRGPDGRGTFFDPKAKVGLGHRRLAILDTKDTGKQPMSYAGGRYWITYNGEIYNFLELRRELEGVGHVFKSESDTEVILAAYVQWGEKCQLRFNGMWAFAIWDSDQRRLFLSRDRFGVKPLHYFFDGVRFAFASEMKAFCVWPWFSRRYDPGMLSLALTDCFAVEGTENCILEGVRRLVGGHQLVFQQGGEPKISRWWNTLDHLKPVPKSYREQVENYRELFLDACRIRMRSDVPLCTSLSGGMDSSSVICSMSSIRQRHSGLEREPSDWRKAFIAAYPNSSQDETQYALAAAARAGAQPIIYEVTPQALVEEFENSILQLGDIYNDAIVGPSLIYKAQRKNSLYVSLDGHGGDECLAGYMHYAYMAFEDALNNGRLLRANDLHKTFQGMLPKEKKGQLTKFDAILWQKTVESFRASWQDSKVATKKLGSKLARRSSFVGSVLRAAISGYRSRRGTPVLGIPEPPAANWLRVAPTEKAWPFNEDLERMSNLGQDALFAVLYHDAHSAFLPTILRNFERASMAHGVEVRCPFMDWRLVTYSFSLPSSSKLGHGVNKRVLRDAMSGILPESIRSRTEKVGFQNPMDDWLLRDLKGWVLDQVNSLDFLSSEIWDGHAIRNQIEKDYEKGSPQAAQRALPYLQANVLVRRTTG